MSSDPLTRAAAEQARNVALQMVAERGRGLVLVGAARLDLALEHLLKAADASAWAPIRHRAEGRERSAGRG